MKSYKRSYKEGQQNALVEMYQNQVQRIVWTLPGRIRPLPSGVGRPLGSWGQVAGAQISGALPTSEVPFAYLWGALYLPLLRGPLCLPLRCPFTYL